MYKNIRENIIVIYESKRCILNVLSDAEKEFYNKMVRKQAEQDEYENSICMLLQFMGKYYNQKVIILILELDRVENILTYCIAFKGKSCKVI